MEFFYLTYFIDAFILLALPFIASPFLVFAYSFISFVNKGHRKNLLLYSVGSSAYFSLIYLLLGLSEIKKFKNYQLFENLDDFAEKKRRKEIEPFIYDGVVAYLNLNFLPIDYIFDFGSAIRKAKRKELRDCFICNRGQSEVFFNPCRHSGVCQDCAKEMMTFERDCPICAKKIRSYTVY